MDAQLTELLTAYGPIGGIWFDGVWDQPEAGDWLRVNGGSIYNTRGGPLPPRPWGVTTQKGDTVYLHLLDGADPG